LPRHRAISRLALVCAVALASLVAGCKNSGQVFEGNNEGGWFSKPVEMFAKPEWANLHGDQRVGDLSPRGPIGPENLVGADGRCSAPGQGQSLQPAPEAAVPPADPAFGSVASDLAGRPMRAVSAADANPNERLPSLEPGAPQVVGGIALGMSECDAVRRAGVPGNVSISGGNKGERKVVLTYLSGPWPGIYHFADGRLQVIERAPIPPASPKAPPKKKTTKTAKPNSAATQVR
jgi:hypothetical protein